MPTQEFKPKPANLQTSASSAASPDDEAIKEIIISRVKTFNPFRRDRIMEWNANIAYLCGHQYIGMQDGQLVERKKGPFSSTVNKIAPAVRNDVAIGTKVPPKFDVVPDSTDKNDKATAIAGNKMAGYLRRINNFDSQRGRIIIWYDITAIGWRKQRWDPFYKVIGHNPEPEQEEHNPDMAPGAPIYQGEALSEHTPTNELIWDWRQNTDHLTWMIHPRPMKLSEIKIRYGPEKALQIPESEYLDPTSSLNQFEIRIFNEFSQFINDIAGNTVKPDPSEMSEDDREVMVYELWQVRDNNYPLGVFAVMAGLESGFVLQNGPYPIGQYPHGEVPFTAYDMMVPDKAVAGTASRISQARPLQNELNDIRSLIRENTAVMGGGLWKVPRDGKINIGRMDNGVGLFVEYDGPYEPHREAGVAVAGQLFVYAATIVNDINDIFSFPQVAQGKRPQGGPKSGVGIALLQEASQTQHSPIIKEMDRKDEKAMTQLLSVAFANYGQRTFNIIGKDNQWTLFEFDPNSYNTNFNVVVRSGSSMPVSKAIERELALGLGREGWLGNPADPSVRKRILEVIDIGGLESILKDNAKDVAFAKKEFQTPVMQYQEMMKQLGPEGLTEEMLKRIYLPAVNPFDNHDVHIIEHKDDLLDKFFEYLGSGDPGLIMIANAMQLHWAQHSEILAQQQLQQAIMTGQIKREDLESSREKRASEKSSSKE
jgi:hypothetical protein